jgi:hypothetical protein
MTTCYDVVGSAKLHSELQSALLLSGNLGLSFAVGMFLLVPRLKTYTNSNSVVKRLSKRNDRDVGSLSGDQQSDPWCF